jgi:hypothetical protein
MIPTEKTHQVIRLFITQPGQGGKMFAPFSSKLALQSTRKLPLEKYVVNDVFIEFSRLLGYVLFFVQV